MDIVALTLDFKTTHQTVFRASLFLPLVIMAFYAVGHGHFAEYVVFARDGQGRPRAKSL